MGKLIDIYEREREREREIAISKPGGKCKPKNTIDVQKKEKAIQTQQRKKKEL